MEPDAFWPHPQLQRHRLPLVSSWRGGRQYGKLKIYRDVNGYTKGKTELDALSTYKGHTSVVTDVAWNQIAENIFGSVGDDKQLMLCVFTSAGYLCY